MHTKLQRTLNATLGRMGSLFMILAMLFSAAGVSPVGAAPSANGLHFSGANTQYVSFGQATTTLGASQFTLELWFRRTAAGGATVSTGTGGVTAYPLLTKGMGEADGSNVDCNYFLGIRSTDNVLVADFEDMTNGLNHPIAGVTALPPTENVWHHAAVTYNGTKWQLFLDGKLEAELNVGKTPRSDSLQYAGLGTAMTSTGARTGFFLGDLDEARIWNYARTQAEILSTMNIEIASPDPSKLLGYWQMNEGSGNLTDSSTHGVTGTITGATWTPNAGFPINVDATAPATPTGLAVSAGDKLITLTWTANAESDLRGYNVYRSTGTPVPTDNPINGSNLVTTTRYVDGGLTNGTPYYYVVTAVDSSGNASSAPTEVGATPASAQGYSMQFNGTNQYVTFGRASRLGVETFTIEGWFKRTGAGLTVDTGGVIAEPLITKGRGEADGSNVDLNYFIGIRPADGFLVADFEDGSNGANHPIIGTSSVMDGTWHHVALAYEPSGTNMLLKLYLDGTLQSTVTITKLLPRADSIQHAALGTAMNSTGVASGYFNGLIDEVRIWDFARTQTDINTNKSLEIMTAPGLLGRWGLNEGTGTLVNDTSSRGIDGTATNSPAWVTDTPFGAPPTPPTAPSGLTATATSSSVVTLGWTDTSNNETGFEIHRSTTGIGGSYTLFTTTSANAVSYPNSGLTPLTEYCYKVLAFNGSGPSAFTDPACATTLAETPYSLQFNGSTQYVTFGTTTSLGSQNFTVETWFKRTGAGTSISTGTNGVTLVPMVAKGAPEGEASSVDENYILGIRASDNVLAGDFETYAVCNSRPAGDNNPISGVTPIVNDTWYHAAFTYDGTALKLYLNGVLESTLANTCIPRYDNSQPAALGTMLTSAPVMRGAFAGVLDEVRIWSVARSQIEIRADINNQLNSGTNLLARWGLNEGTGTTITSSVGTFPGTLTSGPVWVTPGAPFNLVLDTTPPAVPTGLGATPGNTTVALSWTANGEGDLAGYNVYRFDAPSTYTKVNVSLLTSPAYTVTSLTNGTLYTFVVTALDTSANESGYSNTATATPVGDITPPAAPTLLTAAGANAMITLDWADNSEPDLAGYNLYRGTVSGVYPTKVNTSLIIPSTHIDTGLINGTEYYYVVRAVDTSNNESGDSNEAYAIPTAAQGSALEFTTASGTYVTFGDPAKLDLATFTIETWFKRTGAGTISTTGNGGIPNAIPLVTHGAPQAEGSNVDANWVLVIDDSTDVIAADFEDMATGLNHPVLGTTPITDNVWHHAAATFDGTSWRLYLDGKLDRTLSVAGYVPRSDSAQQAGLGTMLTTTGSPNGYFQGVLDEARVWNRALSQTEILANINNQITSGSGLVARWGLNEGTGTTAVDSIVTAADGTITGSSYAWVPGSPFDLNITPGVPSLVVPADAGTGVSIPPTLTVNATDARSAPLTVSFYGRPKVGGPGADFTLIAIPDPQYYASSFPSIYNAQMNWVVTNKTTSAIQYVMSLGDNVDNSTTYPGQFTVAMAAWDRLTTGFVPYGLALGNHDGAPSATANFNTAFGSRLAAQPGTPGHYLSDWDNSYATFSASGMDFIVLYIEYDTGMTSTSNAVLVWANGILAANPTKRAIVVTHDLLDGSSNFTPQGSAIYGALKGNANLFLMLGGHLDGSRQRTDIYNGHTVYSLRSDYQFVDSQQSGYLRVLSFSPINNQIHVTTYSPNQSKYLSDSSNDFYLPYTMVGVPDFAYIGSTTIPSGSPASISWPGRSGSTAYEWYAVADNGGAASASSPTWSFTTATNVQSIPLELGWNLVSFSLHPTNTLVANVLASVAPNYDLVYAWNATVSTDNWLRADNIPASPDTLINLDEKMGFWIHMTSADSLDVVGSTPTTTDIPLAITAGGWNLVGYPSAALDRALPGAMTTHSNLVYAYHAADTADQWKLYDRNGLPYANDLDYLRGGWGYWILVTANEPWTIPY